MSETVAKTRRTKAKLVAPRTTFPFAEILIDWQQQAGRHHLPWQQQRTAYKVWLSEIMLQQTQVSTVLPYYERFLNSFPDVQALAAAETEQVLAHWSGLGYYTRARNLHACAKRVVADYAGEFPAEPELLADLPGIGRSTAAAIAAFAYQKKAAILDGNVKRVLTRVYGIPGFPGEKAVENQLWELAESLLPEQNIIAYTQGLMDLGASLCSRNKPACQRCPMQSHCQAHLQQRTAELPERKPKRAQVTRHALMILLRYADQVLLEQRPEAGIWGGLLSLPEWNGMNDSGRYALDHLQPQLLQRYSSLGEISTIKESLGISHVFSHFRLEGQVIELTLSQRSHLLQQSTQRWIALSEVAQAALPAPVKSLLLNLTTPSQQLELIG